MSEAESRVTFVVEAGCRGVRLDRYLQQRLGGLSRTRVQRILAASARELGSLKQATRVVPGMRVVLSRPASVEPETPRTFSILVHDEHVLVVDKPAGLPVHASARYHHGTLVRRIAERFGEGHAAPVHRLDRETSGVLVCARTSEANRTLMADFRAGRVRKTYLAIVEGWPSETEFVVDAPLAPGGSIVRLAVRVDRANGRPSLTRFVLVERFERGGEKFALLRAFPETGRQHQIRAHLREAGHPLVGDKIYGADEGIYDRFTKHTMREDDWRRLRLERHALHAETIALPHPRGEGELVASTPMPPDLMAFMPIGSGA